jgi:alpha-1,4-digalacturonate transport system substrate-binding protein
VQPSRRFICLAAALLGGSALPAAAAELRFTCYGDANECEAWDTAIAGFEAANLPVQLAGGDGPDLARVTDLGGLAEYMLDITPYVADAGYWEENFGDTLAWTRVNGPDDQGIYSMMDQLTVTGPFVNKTLFDQAGIEMPGEGATWEDWAEASRQVAEATGVPYPMAMDRSGHRFAGPAISYGAQYFDENGEPITVDDGFRAFAEQLVEWNNDGTMAKDVWGAAGGAAYRDAAAEFINASLVFYMSGSWQVARFGRDIGDAFDWVAVPPPCGPGGCTGLPGGAAVVGFKHTEQPEAVGKLLDYMASEPVYAAYVGATRNVSAHRGLLQKGVDYGDTAPGVKESLAVFAEAAQELNPVAYEFQGYPHNRAIMNATVQRVSQAIVGEMALDEALARLDADVDEAVAAAAK